MDVYGNASVKQRKQAANNQVSGQVLYDSVPMQSPGADTSNGVSSMDVYGNALVKQRKQAANNQVQRALQWRGRPWLMRLLFYCCSG